jgi:hypothetical protein
MRLAWLRLHFNPRQLKPMSTFPECLEPLDEAGAHSPIAAQVAGLSKDEIGFLPGFDGYLHWITCELGAEARREPDFLFVVWNDNLLLSLIEHLAAPGYRTTTIILHLVGHAPPKTVSGRPLVHFCFAGKPLDTILRLVPALLMPLIYRSVVCVAIEDFEFLFATGGRLSCLSETRSDDLSLCLAELARDLSEAHQPVGGHSKLIVSILVPSTLPAMSVLDRVMAVVHQSVSADSVVVVSTLGHAGTATWLGVFSVEPTDKL